MSKFKSSINLAFYYGFLIFISLMAYFFVLSLSGVEYMSALRYLNGAFLLGGLIIAVRKFLKDHNYNLQFFQGFKFGVLTSFFATVFYAVFLFVYLNIDNNFLTNMQENENIGQFITPISMTFVILVEGIISGLIFTLGIMQYYKKYTYPRVATQNSDEKVDA